ncbi:MAG TPA: sulfatase-like hydrolase/transferase [Clostridiales bacterium]|nr:sulfatase-like hydrolase/transferase [Clostridiales bacterium]
MARKVILILVDGMRPDSLALCANKFIKKFMNVSEFTLKGKTVYPSITLPCHMSLFHSVPPERHGILSNTYVPQVRPIKGLYEILREAGKSCASVYNWEELRDLGRPGSLDYGYFYTEKSYEDVDNVVTDNALTYLRNNQADFFFLYLGKTDEMGHRYGWMSEKYLEAVNDAWNCIEKVYEAFKDEYVFIITADHGGHGRSHGEDISEDMTIPLFISGVEDKGKLDLENPNIIDIAPTICSLLKVDPVMDWEGLSLYNN